MPIFRRMRMDFMRRIIAPAEWLFMRALRMASFCLADRRTVPEMRLRMRIFLPLRTAIFIL